MSSLYPAAAVQDTSFSKQALYHLQPPCPQRGGRTAQYGIIRCGMYVHIHTYVCASFHTHTHSHTQHNAYILSRKLILLCKNSKDLGIARKLQKHGIGPP